MNTPIQNHKDKITYEDLVARFGKPMAFDLLITIEKMARVRNDFSSIDEGERLQKALDALHEAGFTENDNFEILPGLTAARRAD